MESRNAARISDNEEVVAGERLTIKPVPGLPEIYVSTDGRVWSRRRRWKTDGGWRELRSFPARGYPRVQIKFCDGKYIYREKYFFVHRMMAYAFFGHPVPPRTEVRHLDGSPSNNNIDNLRWGSSAENSADCIRHGTQVAGERHPMHKLTWDEVHYIRAHWRDEGRAMLAERFNMDYSQICKIVKGTIWRE